jgi:hypothetical protein
VTERDDARQPREERTEGTETVDTANLHTANLHTANLHTAEPDTAEPDTATPDRGSATTGPVPTGPATTGAPDTGPGRAGPPQPDPALAGPLPDPIGVGAVGVVASGSSVPGYAGGTGVDVARRRGPDPLALLVGLATLAMAVFAFVGELPDLSGFDPRWLLAGGAALVGLVLLVGSLRGRSRGRRSG